MAGDSAKAKAWAIFDRIVERAAPGGFHTNPWKRVDEDRRSYEPDYETLCKLLGVPLLLKASTTSGVPALALDVWLSYELRRAGFDADQVWPRPTHPRILPSSVAKLLDALPKKEAAPLRARIERSATVKGVTSASATILGKNYFKQVDVIITDWATGPELLISTKRMDSSFGKNAPNRIEESYGDAKNLRLRHPLAALGFVFGLSAGIFVKDRATAEWLFDLLIKLGQEDDAYHATALVLMEYSGQAPLPGPEEDADGIPQPGVDLEDDGAPAEHVDADDAIIHLPKVTIRLDETPKELNPGRYFASMVERVLRTTPVDVHTEARKRRSQAPAA